MPPPHTHRQYAWVPRSEVAWLQAIIDAQEGLARIRTEKHEDNRSLLVFLIPPSRLQEFDDLMHHLSQDIKILLQTPDN